MSFSDKVNAGSISAQEEKIKQLKTQLAHAKKARAAQSRAKIKGFYWTTQVQYLEDKLKDEKAVLWGIKQANARRDKANAKQKSRW